jgi:ribosomal protein L11 methyltransferase
MKAFRVRVPAEHEDWACAVLSELGTAGVEVRDAGDEVLLLSYFRDPPGAGDLEAAMSAVPGASVAPAEVPEVDWVARFREEFHAFSAGPFRVAPAWDVPEADSARLLVVDPGRAFGTGTHETTRLCLGALAALAEDRGLGRLLDVGTGTGILAIAGVRLGARLAVGIDLDPESADSAARHAALNGVHVRIVLGDGASPFGASCFDTVVANISAPLLKDRSVELLRALAPGGTLILSGLLGHDVPELRSAYAGQGSFTVREDGEWAALVLRKEQ